MIPGPDWDMDGLFGLGEVRKKYRVPLRKGERIAEEIYEDLEPFSETMVIVGSIRRRRPEVADVELVVLPKDPDEFHDAVTGMGFEVGEKRRKYTGARKGVKIELYVARKPEELGALVLAYTGDYLLNVAMRSKAKKMGYKMDQYGIWKGQKPALQSPDEREFFDFLGMDWHEPEQRSLARRSELSKLLREFRDVKLSDKDRRFVEEARKRLTEDKYIPADKEAKLESLAKRYLGKSRASLGAEELVELGDAGYGLGAEELVELGDDGKEWMPQVPGEIRLGPPKGKIFPGMMWEFREFRLPDKKEGNTWVWYGPEGPEGDIASEIEIGSDGYSVCEYQGVEGLIDDPEGPILKTCAWIDFEFLAKAFADHGWRVDPERLATDPERWAGYAMSLGSARISYAASASDEEFVDSLP